MVDETLKKEEPLITKSLLPDGVNLIDYVVETYKHLNTPDEFLRGAAYSMISGASGRRVFTEIKPDLPIYANTFFMLVGDPAVGKSSAINVATDHLRKLGKIHIAPEVISKAAVISFLAESQRSIEPDSKGGIQQIYYELYAGWGEYTDVTATPDPQFNAFLNRLYDCAKFFEENKRSLKEQIKLENVSGSLIIGIQPHWLLKIFDEGAWKGGLMTRVIPIYAETIGKDDVIFDDAIAPQDLAKRKNIITRQLELILQQKGRMGWTKEAKKAFVELRESSLKKHSLNIPRFKDYGSRRDLTLVHMSIIRSLASDPLRMVIEADHVLGAYKDLLTWEKEHGTMLKKSGETDRAVMLDRVLEEFENEFERSGYRRAWRYEDVVEKLARNINSTADARATVDVWFNTGKILYVGNTNIGVAPSNVRWVVPNFNKPKKEKKEILDSIREKRRLVVVAANALLDRDD